MVSPRAVLTSSTTLKNVWRSLGALAALVPAVALAGQFQGVDQDPLVSNGDATVECAWPTAVAVVGGGLCTGTLVHPELVVYAAHCGAGNKTIRFGDNAFQGGQSASVLFCETNPDYQGTSDQGHDWAYCRLQEPVTDIPVTPIVFGDCQSSIVQVGQEVAIAGFGETLQGVTGIKHWGLTTLEIVNDDTNITIISTVNSVCPGDSGGPAYIRFPDNSWRAFGIASTVAGGCGGSGTHSQINGAAAWIESASGIDITPCHTIDGEWNPTPACGEFYSGEPGQGYGAYANGCSGTPISGVSDTCGPAWNELDDTVFPEVEITSPVWGDTFPTPATIDIAIDAWRTDGYAIKEVRIEINGSSAATDTVDPWGFEGAVFQNPAIYELVAVAEDYAGNIAYSDPVQVGVGDGNVPGPEPEPEPEDTGDADSGEDDTDNSDEVGEDDLGAAEDGGEGCACGVDDVSGPGNTAAALLSLFVLVSFRRRRAR